MIIFGRRTRNSNIFAVAVVLFTATSCDRSDTDPVQVAGARASSRARLAVIGKALESYQSDIGQYPWNADTRSDRRVSWRVRLLPYLGDDAKSLHARFRLSEPWDSPHNGNLVSQMPDVYATCLPKRSLRERLSKMGMTCFVSLPPLKSVRNHQSDNGPLPIRNELIIEIDAGNAVIWTAPDEFDNELSEALRTPKGNYQGTYHVLLSNGTIERRSGVRETVDK